MRMKQHCGARLLAILCAPVSHRSGARPRCGTRAPGRRRRSARVLQEEMEKARGPSRPVLGARLLERSRSIAVERRRDPRPAISAVVPPVRSRTSSRARLGASPHGICWSRATASSPTRSSWPDEHALRSFLTQQHAILWGLTGRRGGDAGSRSFIVIALVLDGDARLPLHASRRPASDSCSFRARAAVGSGVADRSLAAGRASPLRFPPTAAVLWLLADRHHRRLDVPGQGGHRRVLHHGRRSRAHWRRSPWPNLDALHRALAIPTRTCGRCGTRRRFDGCRSASCRAERWPPDIAEELDRRARTARWRCWSAAPAVTT